MALTDNKIRKMERPDLEIPIRLNVAAGENIFVGAIVALDGSGNAINALITGAEFFMGITPNGFDNTGGGITTDTPLEVVKGQIEELTMDSSPSDVDLGKKVYYTDDDKVSLTIVVTTGIPESQVGVLRQIVSGTTVDVDTSKAIT